MRTLSIITLALASILIPACASSNATQHAKQTYDFAPIAANSATLRVNGMSCPKCANNIERQLASVSGVERVDIDLGAGVVSVAFDPDAQHPSAAQLARAIDNTGFTLVSIDSKATH